MALILADRVQQTGVANTTVSFTLSGTVTGFQSFAVVGNGNTTYYSAFDPSGNWEVGVGTYATGGTLTRTTVVSSSNSGSAVTFSGTVNVFLTYPAEYAAWASNNPGTSGYVLTSNGIGVAPSWAAGGVGTITTTDFTATSGQTVFTVSYTVGLVSVYRNGIKLGAADYTATNGTSITLATGAVTGDLIEVQAFSSLSLSTAVSSFSAGTTGLTPNTATSGNVVLAGTLNIANGGTGATSLSGANIALTNVSNTFTLDQSISGLTVGKGGGSDANSTVIGTGALAGTNTTGYNTAVGFNSLAINTSGVANTAVGYKSLAANTTGRNSALGINSLLRNTTGTLNTGLGDSALESNTTGGNNTAVGTQALDQNTTGGNNTAVGYQSSYSNQTGASNTSVGYSALYANTSSFNTAVGQQSLSQNTSGYQNSALGYQSLYSNTTGINNVAFGFSALQSNTTASNNTAVGYQAGYSATVGGSNTCLGYQAGYSGVSSSGNLYVGIKAGYNSTGNGNTFVGGSASSFCGFANTSGYFNTALGSDALAANTTASNNTAVGYQAGYNSTGVYNVFFGANAGGSNTTGANNVFIGGQAGFSVTTGSGNTFIGTNSGQSSGFYVTTGSKNSIFGGYNGNQGGLDIRTASNYIVLSDGDGNPRGIFDNNGVFLLNTQAAVGSGKEVITNSTGFCSTMYSYGNGADYIQFYNSSQVGSITRVGGTGVAYNTSSDYRLKENIAPMVGALDKVSALKPVTYKWKSDGSDGQGFIAHELAEVAPECVTGEKDAVDDKGEIIPQGVDYSKLVGLLTAAIQELNAKVTALEAQLSKPTLTADQATAKASALAKLTALGFSEDEVKALVG